MSLISIICSQAFGKIKFIYVLSKKDPLRFNKINTYQIFIEKETNILNSATNNDISIVSQINEGDSLGVISFLTGKKSIERFRSIGFTKLLLLSRDDFLKIIPDFPEDYEQYSHFKDQLKLYQRSKFLNMECFSCKSLDHKVLDCPLLHFIPDREFLIKKYQFSRNQERNEITKTQNVFKRGGTKGSVDARLDQDYVQESAIVFLNDHWQESMFFECEDEQPLNLHSSLNMTTDVQYVGNIKPEEDTFKKSSITIKFKIKTRNFQSTSNLEDSLKEIFPVSDHDVSQKSSIKKTKKSVGFKNQEISNVQKLISPLPLLDNVIEEDQIVESRAQQIPKLSNFSLKLNKTNSIFPQQSKFQPVKLSSIRSLKNKFQKAVHIINTLKTIAKLKPLKRCRSIQEGSNIIEQDRMSRIQFERNQLQNLIKRRILINVNKNITDNYAALRQDNQNAEFTILKLQMMLELRIPLNNFEHLKTFKFYFPYNNIEHVLYQQESYYKPNQEHVKQLPQIYSQLVNYMLYPYEYIEKYIFTSINKKFPPPIKRQRTIYPGGILNPQKRKFSKKSLSTRKNQIRPMSDGQMLQKTTTRFQR